jgi:hypothetical protein
MLKAVPSRAALAPVPARSWTGNVPAVGAGFDKGLFRGIFG